MTRLIKVLDIIVKLASLAVTAPVTVAVAQDAFADVGIFWSTVASIGALLLVDAMLLSNWYLLNTQKQADVQQRRLWAATVAALYIGLFILALYHGEGLAGLVFRLALGLALLRDTLDTFRQWGASQEKRAEQGVQLDWRVKRQQRAAERKVAGEGIKLTTGVQLAALRADSDVELAVIGHDKQERLQAIGKPAPPVQAAAQSLPQERVQERRPRKPDLDIAIPILLKGDPDMSDGALAKATGVSRQTIQRARQRYMSGIEVGSNGHS